MARAFHVKSSRKDIYKQGKVIQYTSQKGKRKGEVLTRLDRTLPANDKDEVLIPKGSPYWYWQFKGSDVHYSATAPRRSQLTRSEFLSTLYDLEDEISNYTVTDYASLEPSDLEAVVEEWEGVMEELRDLSQDSLDRMPDNLRDSSDTGNLLQQRVEGMDNWINELEGVSIEWDDDEIRQQATLEWQQLHTPALQKDDPTVLETKDQWIANKFLELRQEAIDDILSQLQSIEAGVE